MQGTITTSRSFDPILLLLLLLLILSFDSFLFKNVKLNPLHNQN